MTTMPGVKFVPLGPQTQPRSRGHHFICIHTMVGYLHSTQVMFLQNGYTGTESHYGTGGDGTIVQWQRNEYTADANYMGSGDVVSIENADHGPEFARWDTRGDNVPAFTTAQLEAIAKILAWESTPEAHRDCPSTAACHREGIPLELIPDTRPGRRGVGYHAQGVPGNGLVAGGTSWSKSSGKLCPGRRRILQIPQIIARARQLRAGQSAQRKDDKVYIIAKEQGVDRVWVGDLLNRRHIRNDQDLKDMQYLLQQAGFDPSIREFANIDALGVDVAARADVGHARDQLLPLVQQLVARDDVDEAKVAEALAPAVITALGDRAGLTRADVEQAVRSVLGSLND